jgi:hypothetical protein
MDWKIIKTWLTQYHLLVRKDGRIMASIHKGLLGYYATTSRSDKTALYETFEQAQVWSMETVSWEDSDEYFKEQ